MRFHKHVTENQQLYLKESLAKYKKEKPMTLSEKAELHKWVAAGKDPYTNGYYFSFENGYPMDYIEAERMNIELCEQQTD